MNPSGNQRHQPTLLNFNHTLLRSLGLVHPSIFARSYTSALISVIHPAPGIRFDGVVGVGFGFDGIGGGGGERAARSSSGSGALSGPLDTRAGRDASSSAETGERPGGMRNTETRTGRNESKEEEEEEVSVAHPAGCNALTIDKFEGRYMLSGGADASIHLWDLESVAARDTTSKSYTLTPSEAVGKQSGQGHHRFGITQLNFYPFDSLAFLSSSYDHSLKIYTTETLRPSASWDLESVVYAHAMSPIATHLMVACALQHPAVRLVDLRSGASTQALSAGASVAGGGGGGAAVLALQWSPHDEHVLASGSADGVVRLWDVRRSAAELITLDVDDAVGVVGYDRPGAGVGLGGSRGRAHDGAVNGVVWTDDGEYIVTAGHDNRIRVWEARSGANTLTTFGPLVKNSHLSTLTPVVAPSEYSEADKRILFYPNERDILCFDLLEGTLLKRLRSSERRNVPGAGGRNKKARVTCLAWKSGSVELYSAHSNGRIEAWLPRTRDEADLDLAEAVESKVEDAEDETRKRKRQVLEDVYRDLTRQKITFG